jgi:two-component system nitrate/nitrite response regulator NarL
MRIMVVSPVRLFRDSLAGVLGSVEPVLEVVAEVSVVALHHRSPGEQPDVVLVDVTQDIGMEEVALVAAKWRNLPLLALGLLERREEVVRRGRAGFVARDATIQDLQSAISNAVASPMQCPAKINGGLPRALSSREHLSTPGHVAASLKRRDTEVLQMIGRGLSNKEIAPSTIDRNKSVVPHARGVESMDSSHVATGTITALLTMALVYLSKWPLQPLDLPTASAFAGLLVAFAGALVKYYKSRIALPAPSVAPVVPIAPPNLFQEPPIAA